jgi:hypothetical protein
MFTLVINLQTVRYLTNERQFKNETIVRTASESCGAHLQCLTIQVTQGIQALESLGTHTHTHTHTHTYLALLQNFLIVASILLIPCIVFAAPCSFEMLSFNAVMQVSPSPNSSVHFEINVIHFSGSGSLSFAFPWVAFIRMSRRLSSLRPRLRL